MNKKDFWDPFEKKNFSAPGQKWKMNNEKEEKEKIFGRSQKNEKNCAPQAHQRRKMKKMARRRRAKAQKMKKIARRRRAKAKKWRAAGAPKPGVLGLFLFAIQPK